MSNLTQEQQRAYDRYVRARNNVSIGQYRKYNKDPWQPTSDVVCSVDQINMNHPLFMENDNWIEYKEAQEAWFEIEAQFRKEERMSMIRGDYGNIDSWREKKVIAKEIE